MVKATLVVDDIATGVRVVDILDTAGLRISLAMWLLTPDYDDLRFTLSSRDLDVDDPRESYGIVHSALEKEGVALEDTPTLLIFRTSDPFVKALRQIFGKMKSVEGMRLGGQTIGGRFIEDAIVYRIK
jgi:hypothetical protein